MKPFAILLLLLALAPACSSSPDLSGVGGAGGAAGAGGTAGAGGGGGNAVKTMSCPDAGGGPIDPTASIDDMEAGGFVLPMEGGRNGSWWAGGDMLSPNATITPNGNASSEPIPNGGRCGSFHAKHVTGQGFTSWALITAILTNGLADGGTYVTLPYDAHIRTGVTFWARIGDTSSNTVRFAVSDKYTRPEGGICDPNATAGATVCYDTAGVDLTLTTTWTQFRIPFAGLGQRNFGQKEGQMGPDPSAIYTIDFNFYPATVFDFWLDDLSFY